MKKWIRKWLGLSELEARLSALKFVVEDLNANKLQVQKDIKDLRRSLKELREEVGKSAPPREVKKEWKRLDDYRELKENLKALSRGEKLKKVKEPDPYSMALKKAVSFTYANPFSGSLDY